MQSVEAEGNTIDDAIANALRALRVGRDRVDIEIVADATRGVFGFGGKKARVRATLRAPLVGVDASAGVGVQETVQGEPPRGPASPAAPAAAENQDTVRRDPPRPARAETRRPEARSAARGATAEIPGSEVARRARETLQEILRLMGFGATVEIEAGQSPEDVVLQVRGESTGVIIGRRGQTLDALEHLVNRALGREEGAPQHVTVDAEGYRARRSESLADLARRLADKAKQKGRSVTLNPLSPRDRRIVHLALQGDPSLTTRSQGTGYYRKLVIIPGPPSVRRERPQRNQPS
jgi:spoIIIJ-associated protein